MFVITVVYQHHFVYKTIRIATGEYYIGIHSTNNLKDGYLGSGNRIRYSVRKYGPQAFRRDILKMCQTRVEALSYERVYVNREAIADPLCLNLIEGGRGTINGIRLGVGTQTGSKQSEDTKRRKRETRRQTFAMRKANGINDPKLGVKWSQEKKAKIKGRIPVNKGCPMSDQQKLKLRQSNLKRAQQLLIDGVVYSSIAEVCRQFCKRRSIVEWKLESDKWDWWYVTEEVSDQ